MPSWSGSHMVWTISSGHSSRSSSSINTSSGSRFLPKSRSDFKLSFNVFLVIIANASLLAGRVCALRFANFVGQFGQKLQDVGDDTHVRYLKDRCLGVLVDGDDERTPFESCQMLERSADAASQVDLRLDGLAGGANLPRLGEPLRINHGARAAHGCAQRIGEFLHNRNIVLFLNASTNRDKYGLFGDVHITDFGDDRLQIATTRRELAGFR